MILTPQTSQDEALILAERLRQRFASEAIEPVGIVTASFGVICDEPCDSLEALTHRVDKALYAAKESGRNCVQTASLNGESQ